MANPPPDTDPDTRANGGAAPRTPGWVKAFGVVALIVALLVAAQLLLGVQHGPGMHGPSSHAGSHITLG